MGNVLRISSAGGVARLLLVASALVAFLVMHGLAATDAAGAHHLSGVGSHNDAPAATPVDHNTVIDNCPCPDPADHDVMAGCLFILLALAAGIVLRALRTSAGPATAAGRPGWVRTGGPARAPPCPVFVSLCVFRL
jgi:hypothetical protein